MIKQEDVYKIGKIGKPHGINGELSFMFDDDIFDRVDFDYLILMIKGILVPFFMEEYRFKNEDTALVKFCDIETKDQAQELTGSDVYFPRSMANHSEYGVSLNEIVGFDLFDANKEDSKVGNIINIDDSTSNMLFEVKRNDGRKILIPASEDLVSDINWHERKITTYLPEGLLDL